MGLKKNHEKLMNKKNHEQKNHEKLILFSENLKRAHC